ncbi:flagellin [Thiospirillum jenense]|uniref:Flagellin n=1 Tax=Thiospirillum jenense TaxID=1653858 RepID=A0A839HHC4_9GAMM|nr:flagellin [Thiospirillum jenense]MBB1126596.1 flagellin [Thiospirillum jenense]
MAQVINTNVPSLNAQRNLTKSQASLSRTLERLSTGLRINSAKDDAAGLGISERFTSQIRGLNQATRNANDGISLAQTAEAVLASAGDILQRMRELAVQAANATNSFSDRQALQDEVNQLNLELDRIAVDSEFNGKKLFDGTFGSAKFQIGANSYQTISVNNTNLRTNKYGNNLVTAGGMEAFAAAPPAWGVNGVGAENVTIRGYLGNVGDTSTAIAIDAGPPADTARDVATKINARTNETGVTANARTEMLMEFSETGSYSLNLTSENITYTADPPTAEPLTVNFTIGDPPTTADSLAAAVTAINDISAKTGITAEIGQDPTTGADKILLTNATGNDIMIEAMNLPPTGTGTVSVQKMHRNQSAELTAVGAAAVTLAAANNGLTITGYLQFDSTHGFMVTSDLAGAGMIPADEAAVMNVMAELDVTSFETATQALKTVDAGIAIVSAQRSLLGAIQSRFDSTVKNLMSTSENLTAARSRIQDADFAVETAELTRSQILQQAGVSVLSQANQTPQNTLKLLQ